MTFCFRVKFRMVTSLDVPKGTSDLALPVLQSTAKISSNQPRSFGSDQWIAIKSCGHSSAAEAQAKAVRLKDSILLAGASGLGADFGTDNVRSRLSDAIKREAKERFGADIRDEVHGIDVFEDGDVKHFTAEAHGSVHIGLPDFAKRITEAGAFPELTRLSRTGAELINDSFFPMPDEARFLLRISAIEALCKQARRPKPVQDLINALVRATPSLTLDDCAAETMRRVLMDARRQSVRQGCLTEIRARLGDAAAAEFDKLYDLRSRYLHSGKGRGSLSAPAEEARRIATNLLFAEITNTVVEPDKVADSGKRTIWEN